MKLKIFSSLVALGLVVNAVGCGDDSVDGNGGGGAGDNDGGTGGTGGTLVLDGGGGTAPMGDGNDSIETAEVLEENANGLQIGEGLLDPVATDVDYYQFLAAAGTPVAIEIEAVGTSDGEGVIDTFITVYDANGEQLARNDDPPVGSTDSFLQFFVPADGNYYVAVEEWCTSATADPEFCNDAYFDSIEQYTYTVSIYHPLPSANSFVEEFAEPNETVATATLMEYEPVDGSPGDYYVSIAYGDWETADDNDGTVFTVPADLAVGATTRPQAWFHLVAPGVDNNGGSKNPGVIEVSDAETGDVLARFDYSAETTTLGEREELQVPVAVSGQYLLSMPEGPDSDGALPYYFVWHGLFDGNPVETQEPTNDLIATPELLTESVDDDDVAEFFIEGDVTNIPSADVDHFRVPVGDVPNLYIACGGKTSGSGATLEVTVFSADGLTELGTQIEDEELFIEDLDVSGEESVIVQVQNNAQVAGMTGAWYRCGIRFIAPE